MEVKDLLSQIQSTHWQHLKVQALGQGSWRISGFASGRARCLTVVRRPDRSWRLLEAGRVWRLQAHASEPDTPDSHAQTDAQTIERAPMEGILRQLMIQPGAQVEAGQPLYLIEAMKMQIQVCAEVAGQITGIQAQEGASIRFGQQILSFQAN